MNNVLLVGVDVHRQRNQVVSMNAQGQVVGPRLSVDNNRPGTERLVEQLVAQVEAGGYEAIQLAAEATGWYWLNFFQMMRQDPRLQPWPLALYALNPRVVAGFRKTYVDRDKTDQSDAFIIADRLRLGRDLPQPFALDERTAPLRFLTRYRHHLVHVLVREKNLYLSLLYLKASEYDHPDKKRRPFSDVFGATSRAVIQRFACMEQVAAMELEELADFIDRKGKHQFADPTATATKLQQVARDSYPLPEVLQEPINLILTLSLQQIDALRTAIKRLDTVIAERLAAIPHTLDTIPGFGPVFSAGIIAEIGDLARFNYDQAKVAKFAGFKWRRTQSAEFEAEETRLTRTGNAYLRYYFCEAANAVRMHDAEYAAYYDRKFREARKHKHKRAIVLTARKLVRLVVRLLTTNQPYRPRRPQAPTP